MSERVKTQQVNRWCHALFPCEFRRDNGHFIRSYESFLVCLLFLLCPPVFSTRIGRWKETGLDRELKWKQSTAIGVMWSLDGKSPSEKLQKNEIWLSPFHTDNCSSLSVHSLLVDIFYFFHDFFSTVLSVPVTVAIKLKTRVVKSRETEHNRSRNPCSVFHFLARF